MPHDAKPRTKGKKIVPLIPLRDIIVFPYTVIPLFIGREKSVAALEEAMSQMSNEKDIILVAQKNPKTNDPTLADIYSVGTLGTIIQMLRLPDSIKILVEGKKRARILEPVPNENFMMVQIEEIVEKEENIVEIEALMRTIQSTFETYIKLNKRIPPEMLISIAAIDDPSRLADTIAAHLALKLDDKQLILEIDSPTKRLEKLYEFMQAEIEILDVEKKIRNRVKKQMEKTQKEYFLNEQMSAIQKELGEKDEFKNEIQELEERIKEKKMSKEASEKTKKELKKLKMMSPMSAEATVVRNYIDWLLAMPWFDITEEKLDIAEAERILDEDHYGLEKVKERIVEHLATQKLTKNKKGPILCFVGPPGVGKTSLARSIARATGRNFVRLSLGGVRDEAEIRGHRRTYIGALPGKIIQSLKKAKSSNPVFLLDEVDKMSMDFRGDPSAALLEVLDPEQNFMFNDHYLDCDYDLSQIMFITTANTQETIPAPLQDRMEIIRIPGYTEYEKLKIALKYLVPKEREANGVADIDVTFEAEGIEAIIHHYTKESGVRSLEREIASICRKIAKEVYQKGKEGFSIKINSEKVPHYLGVKKYRIGKIEERDEIGMANGLAVTAYGGDLLSTEVMLMPGKGKLIITGKLGEIMQESAQAAMTYVRTRQELLGLDKDFYQKNDLHIHFPEGGIPKDGPSAGITMATALFSAITRIPVKKDIAMTGEITIRGRVLPVGGLKEKILAAHRGDIKKVIIPVENEKDLKDIPKMILDDLQIILVEFMDDVLFHALSIDDIPATFLANLCNRSRVFDPQIFLRFAKNKPPEGVTAIPAPK